MNLAFAAHGTQGKKNHLKKIPGCCWQGLTDPGPEKPVSEQSFACCWAKKNIFSRASAREESLWRREAAPDLDTTLCLFRRGLTKLLPRWPYGRKTGSATVEKQWICW